MEAGKKQPQQKKVGARRVAPMSSLFRHRRHPRGPRKEAAAAAAAVQEEPKAITATGSCCCNGGEKHHDFPSSLVSLLRNSRNDKNRQFLRLVHEPLRSSCEYLESALEEEDGNGVRGSGGNGSSGGSNTNPAWRCLLCRGCPVPFGSEQLHCMGRTHQSTHAFLKGMIEPSSDDGSALIMLRRSDGKDGLSSSSNSSRNEWVCQLCDDCSLPSDSIAVSHYFGKRHQKALQIHHQQQQQRKHQTLDGVVGKEGEEDERERRGGIPAAVSYDEDDCADIESVAAREEEAQPPSFRRSIETAPTANRSSSANGYNNLAADGTPGARALVTPTNRDGGRDDDDEDGDGGSGDGVEEEKKERELSGDEAASDDDDRSFEIDENHGVLDDSSNSSCCSSANSLDDELDNEGEGEVIGIGIAAWSYGSSPYSTSASATEQGGGAADAAGFGFVNFGIFAAEPGGSSSSSSSGESVEGAVIGALGRGDRRQRLCDLELEDDDDDDDYEDSIEFGEEDDRDGTTSFRPSFSRRATDLSTIEEDEEEDDDDESAESGEVVTGGSATSSGESTVANGIVAVVVDPDGEQQKGGVVLVGDHSGGGVDSTTLTLTLASSLSSDTNCTEGYYTAPETEEENKEKASSFSCYASKQKEQDALEVATECSSNSSTSNHGADDDRNEQPAKGEDENRRCGWQEEALACLRALAFCENTEDGLLHFLGH